MKPQISTALKVIISALIGLVWLISFDFFSRNFPMLPFLLFSLIFPLGAVLIQVFLMWRVPPEKGRVKYVFISILGAGVMSVGGFLQGPLGDTFFFAGLLIWILGICLTGRKGKPPFLDKETQKTPKRFLKRCVQCGREIPIASEQCPYCMQKQP